jgi:hypothetical protein
MTGSTSGLKPTEQPTERTLPIMDERLVTVQSGNHLIDTHTVGTDRQVAQV